MQVHPELCQGSIARARKMGVTLGGVTLDKFCLLRLTVD